MFVQDIETHQIRRNKLKVRERRFMACKFLMTEWFIFIKRPVKEEDV